MHLTLGRAQREASGDRAVPVAALAPGLHDRHPRRFRRTDDVVSARGHPGDGRTRYLPGSHLRIVSEAAIGRYQNIRGQQHVVCPAGSLLVLHHGIWHGGGSNASETTRHMVKIRLNPTVPQVRLWDTSDFGDAERAQRPIFWQPGARADGDLHDILCEYQPWFEADTARLEFINRVRLFRYLLGDRASTPTTGRPGWSSRPIAASSPRRAPPSADRSNEPSPLGNFGCYSPVVVHSRPHISDTWEAPCPVPSSSGPPARPSASSRVHSPRFSAMDLGGIAIKAALERAGVGRRAGRLRDHGPGAPGRPGPDHRPPGRGRRPASR